MKVSYNQLSEYTGFSYRTIRRRIKAAGIKPVGIAEGPGGSDLWDSAEALTAIFAPLAVKCEGLDPHQEKARLDKLRADHQEMTNLERARVLAPVSVTGRIIADIAVNVRAKVQGIPSKIAAILPAELRPDIFKEAERLTREILADLAAYVPDIPDQDKAGDA